MSLVEFTTRLYQNSYITHLPRFNASDSHNAFSDAKKAYKQTQKKNKIERDFLYSWKFLFGRGVLDIHTQKNKEKMKKYILGEEFINLDEYYYSSY